MPKAYWKRVKENKDKKMPAKDLAAAREAELAATEDFLEEQTKKNEKRASRK